MAVNTLRTDGEIRFTTSPRSVGRRNLRCRHLRGRDCFSANYGSCWPRGPKPASTSLLEWAFSLEQEWNKEPVGGGRWAALAAHLLGKVSLGQPALACQLVLGYPQPAQQLSDCIPVELGPGDGCASHLPGIAGRARRGTCCLLPEPPLLDSCVWDGLGLARHHLDSS